MMRRFLNGVLALGAVFLAVSCASIPTRAYSGAPLQKDVAVHIAGKMQKGQLMPLLELVDGIAGKDHYWEHFSGKPHFNSGWDGSILVEVAPGKHTLVCRPIHFIGNQVVWNRVPETLEFTAEPGKTYYLNAYLADQTQPGRMSCRIEEAPIN